MKYCYVVEQGQVGSDIGTTMFICRTKKIAVAKLRADGFSHCQAEDIWHFNGTWRTIDRGVFLE